MLEGNLVYLEREREREKALFHHFRDRERVRER